MQRIDHALALACLALAVSSGCRRTDARFVPSQSSARQALETALAAWKDGRPPGRFDDVSPAVQVVDSKWQSGARLESFEILQEEEGEGPRWFSVRLILRHPAKTEVVRYAVLGMDPLWVYGEQDYAKLSGA